MEHYTALLISSIQYSVKCDRRWNGALHRMGDEAYSALIEQAENELPLKQVATAEDVAETLVWFLEGAKLITGEVLIVDSGAHLGSLPKYSSSED